MRRFIQRTASGFVEEGVDCDDGFPQRDLTQRIIGCAIEVHKALGPGFLESIYENALCHELGKQGLAYQRQLPVEVLYDGVVVGEHRLDVFVQQAVVVELKSVDKLSDTHLAQILSTMKAVGCQVGLLINFDVARLVNGIRRAVLTGSSCGARTGPAPNPNALRANAREGSRAGTPPLSATSAPLRPR